MIGRIDGTALLEYFAPLKQWLDEQNKGKKVGWYLAKNINERSFRADRNRAFSFV